MFHQETQADIITQKLAFLSRLFEQKYLGVEVACSYHADSSVKKVIEVRFLNSCYGVNEGVDKENKRPIQYLKTFDAAERQEAAKHSYWSYSILSIDASKLDNIIDGLETMPMPSQNNYPGKIIAMC